MSEQSTIVRIFTLHRLIRSELLGLGSCGLEAKRILDVAIDRLDVGAIEKEGHSWSGRVGVNILELAHLVSLRLDEVETA